MRFDSWIDAITLGRLAEDGGGTDGYVAGHGSGFDATPGRAATSLGGTCSKNRRSARGGRMIREAAGFDWDLFDLLNHFGINGIGR